jgi:IMP dehydrogenase
VSWILVDYITENIRLLYLVWFRNGEHMVNIIQEGLCFDDVLLVPKHSTVKSRSEIDISVKMGAALFDHPIIPANMATVAGKEMCHQVIKSGGLAILHRFMSPHEQLRIANKMVDDHGNENFAVSIGVQPSDRELVDQFYNAGVRTICIDIAHGDSQHCVEMCQWLRKNKPNLFIIAGNVATGEGAERLWQAGADVVKCGIGNGSTCSTRIETANGVPQLTALMNVANMKESLISRLNKPLYIIADGGCKNAGDVVKSLCFADMVMSGGLFAGAEETSSKNVMINGLSYKEYVGSSTHKNNHIEGVIRLVKNKGKYNDILSKLLEGLRSGCSYQNAHNLRDLKENPFFIKISDAGLTESYPSSLIES